MRRSTALIGALLATAVLAAPVLATDPDWDWQATYVYTSAGEVDSRTLDLEGDYWIECDSVTNVLHTSTSTNETVKKEIDRIDTANLFIERVVYDGETVTTDRWSCDGAQIAMPEPEGGSSCSFTLIGACSFQCGTNGYVTAYATGVLAVIEGSCNGMVGGPATCATGTVGACVSPQKPRIGLPAGGVCILRSGISHRPAAIGAPEP